MKGAWRALSDLMTRGRWFERTGRTFQGKRDTFRAFGYSDRITLEQMRGRFNRNGVANRVVKALPQATWHGGFDITEDEDPMVTTTFEQSWDDLQERLEVKQRIFQVDVLARLGNFAVLVIGAPGETIEPLDRCTADQIEYLMPYSQLECKVFKWDMDSKSPRYGLPELYTITRSFSLAPGLGASAISKQVHWTRVIHAAEGMLDDRVYGEPALLAPWNYLDDLDKVAGGGAEAFYRRADGGTQFDLDPTMEIEDEQLDSPDSAVPTSAASANGIKRQVEEMEHGWKRNLFTRGVTITRMGSDVADYSGPVQATISLISAATGIPQRVLMGSEQAKLAARADRTNWDDRVTLRRQQFGQQIVRQLVDRFVKLGALPEPQAGSYDVQFTQLKVMDDVERAKVATDWAALNKNGGPVVVLPNEIRELLELGPLDETGATEDVQFFPNKTETPEGAPTKPGGAPPKPGDQKIRTAQQRRRDSERSKRKYQRLSAAARRYYREQWAVKAAADNPHSKWDGLHRAMDRNEPKIRTFVRRAFEHGRAKLDRRALTAALEARDHSKVLELVGKSIQATDEQLRQGMSALLKDTLDQGAAALEHSLKAGWFDPKTGIDDHGRGDRARIERAKKSYVPMTKAKLGKATEQEQAVAKAIGGEHIGHTAALDVVVKNAKGDITHAVEVKTIFGKHDKVTMHPRSRIRKEKEAAKLGAKTHTVAVDMRSGKATYYHRQGFGSFRLHKMTKVGSNKSHIKEHLG